MGIKVLAVDDDPGITRMLKLSLETEGGFEVIEENSAARVIATAANARPDVILLDVVMPEGDAKKTIRELSGRADTRDIRVILLTSLAEGGNGENGLPDDLKSYPRISKPAPIEAIVRTLREVLGISPKQ